MAREDRIASLAMTLKSSGLAKSDVQAKMMAEEMIGVEENVQKKFDEEHTKAHDFLKTAKNLGTAGQIKQKPVEQKPAANETLYTNKPLEELKQPNVIIKPLEPSVKENIIQDITQHNVHSDVQGAKSLKDLMFEQIQQDKHEIKNIEELKPMEKVVEEIPKIAETAGETVNVTESPVNQTTTYNNDTPVMEEKPAVETSSEKPVLDNEKLASMMEEDGPMEEHTREIKEKPKDVKPKEAYEENSIDLSKMFNVNK